MSITFIPFYPSDFLAGTRGLSAEEVGVYITLLCRMYEMAGPIERDDNRLARLCGTRNIPSFVKVLEYLIDDGKITFSEGELFNDRAALEVERVVGKSSKASDAANARWDKKANKNNRRVDADASPKHMPQPCQPKPKPKPKLDTSVSNGETGQFELLSSEEKGPDEATQAVELWNSMAAKNGLSSIQKLSVSRHKKLTSALRDLDGIEGWVIALWNTQDSDFLAGRVKGKDWKASFDFLLQPKSLVKVMERSYPPYKSEAQPRNSETQNAIDGI
tara:strand:- start:19138 stop:19962 length:825 start_codon:yes stop_codon:yes gene_type:complete